jgi:hypothetical protein
MSVHRSDESEAMYPDLPHVGEFRIESDQSPLRSLDQVHGISPRFFDTISQKLKIAAQK